VPIPFHCPNPSCPYSSTPPHRWCVRYGTYTTRAHGQVQRFRCRSCGKTSSTQTESLHYYAKRRLPLQAVWLSLLGGCSLREIARRYGISPPTIQNAMLRLGRQAMAAQLHLLGELRPRKVIAYDGLRSFITSQDYPCDITAVVEAQGEVILSMVHSVMRRGGVMTPKQRERMEAKDRVWRPEAGSVRGAISLLNQEIWEYLRPSSGFPVRIDTDEHPLYRALLAGEPVGRHLSDAGLLVHVRTPSSAPRTMDNPLFPVNYVDRLLRHRLKEHTRETIAFGRQATLQMHRGWIFAHDHNCRREHRVRRPKRGSHAEQGAVMSDVVRRVNREFFSRRIDCEGRGAPESILRVWTGRMTGPPVRWKSGQKRKFLRIPAYALRDLARANPHAA